MCSSAPVGSSSGAGLSLVFGLFALASLRRKKK
jgi:MYXO-CTERM domain-containing protein